MGNAYLRAFTVLRISCVLLEQHQKEEQDAIAAVYIQPSQSYFLAESLPEEDGPHCWQEILGGQRFWVHLIHRTDGQWPGATRRGDSVETSAGEQSAGLRRKQRDGCLAHEQPLICVRVMAGNGAPRRERPRRTFG